MALRVFRDEKLDRRFARDGFVVVPVLTGPELEHLRAVFRERSDELLHFMRLSVYSGDPEHRRQVFQQVREVFQPRLNELVHDREVVAAWYVVKEAASVDSSIELHQDATLVNEPESVAVQIWCPLADVGTENGCLTVIPRSHGWSDHLRPIAEWPQCFPYRDVLPALKARYETPLPLRAGHAVLFDGRLIHGSRPNRSGERRLAAYGVAVPRGAPLRVYYRHSPEALEAFDVESAFFWRDITIQRMPDNCASVGRVGGFIEPFREEQLPALDGAPGGDGAR